MGTDYSDMNIQQGSTGWLSKALNWVEVAGNKLPDPAMLFALLLAVIWDISWPLSGLSFSAVNPASGDVGRFSPNS